MLNSSRQPASNAAPRRQRGVTLLEVLIAVLVLSIGLLGLASLQANSLRFNHSAYLRSQATILSYDMIDRLRANRETARAGAYELPLGTAAPSGTTPAELDLAEWRAQLAATLPAGEGGISVDGATGIVTVRVRWDDTRGTGAPTEFVFRTQL